MTSVYGYITGEFDIDPENDQVDEIARINDAGEIEYLLSIESNRDLTGLNVQTFKDSLEYSNFLVKKNAKNLNTIFE